AGDVGVGSPNAGGTAAGRHKSTKDTKKSNCNGFFEKQQLIEAVFPLKISCSFCVPCAFVSSRRSSPSTRSTSASTLLILVSVNHAPHDLAKGWRAEVEQNANSEVHQARVRERLFHVSGRGLLGDLHLDDE